MKKFLFAAAAVAAISSTPAFAQEAGDFSGAKGTAIVGYDTIDLGIAGLDNVDGFLYGVAIGYDGQSDNIVYGFELEATESTGEISNAAGTIEVGRDLYAGGRLGFVAGDSALIYAKAGYTNARSSIPGAGGTNGDGIRVGGGVEFNLSDNVFARGEYRYSNYEAGVERHQAVAGIGIRF